jgi:hypothetical protein
MTTTEQETGLGRLNRDRDRAGAALEALQDAAARLGSNSLAEQLTKLAEQFRRDVLRVAFVGHFDAGKSTLINALLGHRVLPARHRPTTAVITIVRSGDEEVAWLHPRGGGEPIAVPIGELADHLVIDGSDDAPPQYDPVVLSDRAELLAEGIELADTPGLGDAYANGKARLDAVVRYVAAADAVVYVSPSNGFMGDGDQSFVHHVLQPIGHRDIFVACTRAEALEEDGDDVDARADLVRSVADIVPAERLFFVNGLGAVKAHDSGDRAALAASGVPALEAGLRSFLLDRRGAVKLARARLAVERVSDVLTAEIAAQRDVMTQNAELVRRRCKAVEDQLPTLRNQRESVLRSMDPIVGRLETEVQAAAVEFLQDAADSCSDWAAATDHSDTDLGGGFNPFGKGKAAAKAVAETISRRLQQEVVSWQRTTLVPIVDRHLAEMRAALDPELSSAAALADQLLLTLDGREDQESAASSLRWHLDDLGQVEIGGPGGLDADGLVARAQQAVIRMITVSIFANMALIVAVLPAIVVAAALGLLLPGIGARLLRGKVGQVAAERLRKEAESWGVTVRTAVADSIGPMRTRLSGAMDDRVADIEDRIATRRAAMDGDPDGTVRTLDRATDAVRFAQKVADEIR